MRVYEAAKEFGVSADVLIQLLRELGAGVRSEASTVDDATVAKLRARFERERRAGRTSVEEVVEAVMEDVQPTSGRRRRRRRRTEAETEEPPVEVLASDTSESPVADAAEAIAADAAEEAADRDAELVTTGGGEATGEAIEVGSPGPEAASDASPRAAEEPEPVEEAEPAADEEAAEEEAIAAEEAEAEEEAAELAAEAGEAETEEAAEPREDRTRRPKRVSEMMPELAKRRAKPAPAASAGPGGKVRIQAEGYTTDGKRKKRRKKRRSRVDQDAVQENVQRVMAELKSGGTKKRRRSRSDAERRQEEQTERERRAAEEAQTVRVNEFLTVAELAELIDADATEIISSAFKNLGLMVTMNQRLDFDQIELLLDEFGYRAVREEEYGAELVEDVETEDRPEDLEPRPPVVTVMGHVDHGKTSLLDYVRKANVIAGEAGGITQHIGAYHVELEDGRSLSFLDTPGHAAFTAMRARGAEVTDLVILVVAADDAVMPQTIEAISHAKTAGVPVVVAINKTDLPAADPMRVKQELLEHEVVVEEFGGNVLCAEVSAKTGEGIDDLLDKVLLQAELMELKANPDRAAQGVVIEAELDVGKGPVATVLVTNGTLRVGDPFVCGLHDGKVRALLDERGNTVEAAGPSIPVQVLGIAGVPQAGDALLVMDADRAGDVAQTRQRLDREKQLRIKSQGVRLTDISKMMAEGEAAQLNVVIKGDVDGSVQALADAIEQLSTDEVEVDVIHRGVGAINKSDVLLAQTASAIIIGFHVRPDADARQIAEREGVDIRVYSVIYEAVEDVRAALEGLLEPEEREVLLGAAEVRQLFKVPRAGTIAGCYVTEGVVDRRARVRVVRDGVQIYEGELGSLKRFKDDVREVREGFECGMNIVGYNDIKVGDVIECFRVEEVARTLAGATGAEGA